MKRQQAIFLVTVVAISETFNLVNAYGYGSSGRGSTTPSSTEDDDSHEQWGGIGHGHQQQSSTGRPTQSFGQGGQQSNWGRTTENYGQASSQTSNRYEKGQYQTNQFSQETHLERYGYPEYCVHEPDPHQVCNFYVEITKERGDPHNLHFELSSRVPNSHQGSYVAVGLSNDQQMGEDHIVECLKRSDGSLGIYHSWSTGKVPVTRLADDQSVFEIEGRHYDPNTKLLTCKFRRPIITHVQINSQSVVKFDLEKGKYYILLAVGPTENVRRGTSDQLGFHGNNPVTNGFAYVSPNLLGYSQEDYATGHFGGFNGNGGQAMESYATTAFILLFFPVRMLFY